MDQTFNNLRLLVVGDVMLDRYWSGPTNRTSPEAPVPIVDIQEFDDRPGAAANVAMNVAALSAKCNLIGVIGADDQGQIINAKLAENNIKTDFMHANQTITKLRVLSQHQQLIRLDFNTEYHSLDHAKLLQSFKASLDNVDAIIFSDYAKGTLTCLPEMLAIAKQKNIKTFVSPVGESPENLTAATGVIINRDYLYKHSADQNLDLETQARELFARINCQAILLTLGEQGMYLITPEQTNKIPAATRSSLYDNTGVKDTVTAMLTLGFCKFNDWYIAGYLASLAASVAVNKIGTVTVSSAELAQAFTQKQNNLLDTGVVSAQQCQHLVSMAKQCGEKVVMTNGCFDLLHAGHVAFLKAAKTYGDRLIVAINDDASIKRLKGEDRPRVPLATRMRLLAELKFVDWVISFSEDTPNNLITLLQPAALVKGGDYSINEVVGAELVLEYGGEIHVIDHDFIECSTTNIISKIEETN